MAKIKGWEKSGKAWLATNASEDYIYLNIIKDITYAVYVGKYGGRSHFSRIGIKTKKEAYNIAMNYMRKHPNI